MRIHPPARARAVSAAAALLAVGALTPAISTAQEAKSTTSVQLYGRMDLGVARNIGNKAYVMQYGSGDRIGLQGSEDLGNGLKAIFNIEHGFNADTGTLADSRGRFWNRRSFVGLENSWGKFWLGRDYTPAYIYAQLAADPWGDNTVAQFLTLHIGGITPVRVDKTANLTVNAGPVLFSAQLGQAGGNGPQPTVEKPVSFALRYKGGPLYVGYGYENPGNVNDVWHFATANYDFGPVTVYAGFGDGKTTTKAKIRTYQLSAMATIGPGDLMIGWGQREDRTANRKLNNKSAIGYHYRLSKRTKLYADVANDSKAATAKTGFDVGIFHLF